MRRSWGKIRKIWKNASERIWAHPWRERENENRRIFVRTNDHHKKKREQEGEEELGYDVPFPPLALRKRREFLPRASVGINANKNKAGSRRTEIPGKRKSRTPLFLDTHTADDSLYHTQKNRTFILYIFKNCEM